MTEENPTPIEPVPESIPEIVPEPVQEVQDPTKLAHDRHEQQRKLRARKGMRMSIIFGVRDRAQYAKKVIRSLLVQDIHRDLYDIVVVDFGSQDDLKTYIDLIKANNIKYIAIPKAKQYDRARAFNVGAKATENHLLVFTESDLLFPKYALRMIRDYIVEHEGKVLSVQQKHLQKLETAIIIGKTYSDYGEILAKIDLNSRPCTHGCIATERPVFEELGGFDEDYSGESHEVNDFMERAEQNNNAKVVLEDVHVLHMWHNEITKESEGYYWELYNRKRQIASQVRNINREWGVLVPKRPKVLFMMSPQVWEPGSICKRVGEFLYPYYEIEMCGAREDLRGKTTRKYDLVFSIDWRLPHKVPENCRIACGIFDYISWNDGVVHNVPPQIMQDRLQHFDAIAVPCRDLREIFVSYHPNTFYTPVGVDTEIFRPLKYKRRVSGKFTVGWVGKPENQHTVEGYLEHIKPICNHIPDVELFSAPGGEDINGPTQMLGFYNAIDVLVLFHDTLGDMKSILEAMSCGIPVITTKVSDTQELIENNANGIIIPRNEEELTNAIIRLKDNADYRKRMGQYARETITRQWDWRDKAIYWKMFFDSIMEVE